MPRHRASLELKNSTLEKLGYDSLPHYVEPPFSKETRPDLAGEYPLTLIGGSGCNPFFHSGDREITRIRPAGSYPRVAINPQLAEQHGIRDGDWVWIEAPAGRVQQRALLTPAVAPDTIQAERGWWYPEKEIRDPVLMGVFESNINVCLDDDPETCDEACGSWCTRGARCRIVKVGVNE